MANGEKQSFLSQLGQVLLPIALIFGLVLLFTLDSGSIGTEPAEADRLEVWLRVIVGYFASGAEIAAALVIGLAVVRGFVGYLIGVFSRASAARNTVDTRLRLGRALALGLEFTVASDILKTAVAPTRQEHSHAHHPRPAKDAAQLLSGARNRAECRTAF